MGTGGGETTEMKVPAMGDSISDGTIVEWLKKEGDWVDADEIIASIETDKVRLLVCPESILWGRLSLSD